MVNQIMWITFLYKFAHVDAIVSCQVVYYTAQHDTLHVFHLHKIILDHTRSR
jgi:hypothetical protein